MLAVLFCGVLLAALDIAITGPALPAFREAFALAPRSAAWVFNVFVLFNLVGVPLTTRWADRVGRRTVFAASVATFGAGALVVALAPSFSVVLAGRAVQGAAASGIFPAASAMVGDTVPADRRGRALGILGAVYGLAFLIGPALAGVVLGVAHWRWLYGLVVPFTVLVAAVAWRMLPPTQAARPETVDGRGIVTLGLTLAALAYGVNQVDAVAPLRSLLQLDVGGLIVAAGVGAVLFVRFERRAVDPLLRLDLFRNRQIVLASLLGIGAGIAEATFIFFSDLAVAAFAVPKSTASYMLMPLVAAVAFGAPVAGRVLDRVGSRAIALSGMGLLTLGLAAIALRPAARIVFYGGSVTLGLGLACLLGSALSYILLQEAQEAERTVVQGLNTMALGVGQLLGGALIGAVAASAPGVTGYAQAFGVVAVVGACGTALALGLRKRAATQDQPDGPHEKTNAERRRKDQNQRA